MNITQIQKELTFYKIDGWLLYDFHGSNPLAVSVMQLEPGALNTRRCFYFIPREGVPIKLVHKIENHNLDHLPGEKKTYFSHHEMRKLLGETLMGIKTIAMEYSPNQAIPTVSMIDGGLIDLVEGFGGEVVSSAPFLQAFTCLMSDEQYQLHREAAQVLEDGVSGAWDLIRTSLKKGKEINEYQVQQFILDYFEKEGCVTEGVPICGVNGNAADPHYIPTRERHAQVKKGDFILIDLWCKKNLPHAIFADITRVGIAAEKPNPKQQEVFSLVRRAQKEGTDLVIRRYKEGKEVQGGEVDKLVRKVIEEGGYGDYFTHRTGHNIYTVNHGPGANLDAIETDDHRPLIPRTCFSVEPGVYLPGEFGVRLEYDVYIHSDGRVEVTQSPQEELICIT